MPQRQPSIGRLNILISLRLPVALVVLAAGAAVAAEPEAAGKPRAADYFRIQVVDEQTGRGVPLVELKTVNQVRYVTDSNGLVAFHEPGLMGRPIYFFVQSHGYEFSKDGFGNAGTALDVQAGGRATLRLKRVNIAQRLYRITGAGIYRDSVLLGEAAPLEHPLINAQVAGQDSAFGVPYRGKIYWFWGDTSRMRYPLGHFWMAGAISDLPTQGGLDPAAGVNLRYFTDAEGFSRPVCRLGVERGMIWADTFAAVVDETGRERLICRYAHMESLQKMLAHGLAIYNDETEEFERLQELDLKDRWRFPAQAHPNRVQHEGREYLQFGDVFATVRVPARLESLTDLNEYEYFTCLAEGSTLEDPQLDRDAQGRLVYGWRRNVPPISPELEHRLLEERRITPEEARFSPRDADSGKLLRMHRGSVRWNEHRRCWIMIAGEVGGTSVLGEIWYAEAPQAEGPWRQAKKIVTHDRYSFYNPVHHSFFDQEGGRVIYFEGTYTSAFSGNETPTPWYDYNQIMYRLDLDDPRLHAQADDGAEQ